MGTDIVLAIGYGTYKLTAEDTKAYQLVNSLDPYYKAEIDAANNRYCVVSAPGYRRRGLHERQHDVHEPRQ